MELTKDNVTVEWIELGEGWSGDYNPDDPEDQELLRFDVIVNGENVASNCTQFPVSTSDELKQAALELIMDRVYEPASSGEDVEKLCDRLSWISPEWLEKKAYWITSKNIVITTYQVFAESAKAARAIFEADEAGTITQIDQSSDSIILDVEEQG